MKKILSTLICVISLNAQNFVGADFMVGKAKDYGLNLSDNGIYQGRIFINSYKLSNYDNDFVFGADLSIHDFDSEYKNNIESGKISSTYTAVNVLGGIGFFNNNVGVKSGFNILGGLGHEKIKSKTNTKDLVANTNLIKLGASTMNIFDEGLVIEASAFAKFYLDNKRDKLFNEQQKRLNYEANLMLGYKFTRNLDGFYAGIKASYTNDVIAKGIRYGVNLGYSF
ncbi:hypothetical protein KJQ97_01415 [Campylobacter sp. 2018MI01]|uniref:hypothetical protein n=1 Tax=unclassified Campylobacter TaxID=2593542 RepID=UPI001BD9F3AF|nr:MULTISPECIES: hypothetical protein [unclassified Campylobacter]MBT0878079.1 hypothetical protein [Campylobacter sp. 2018MI01]MBT0881915.1 hypothetical protein [Campylobacter sp. 2018MI13]